MYNESIKKKYIEEVVARNINIDQWFTKKFNQVEIFEIKNNTDISDFTIDEIIEFYKYINTTSLNSLIVLNSQMSLYSDWCIKNNYSRDNINHFLEITSDIIHKCLNTVLAKEEIISREKLEDYIDELPNYGDKFLVMALFEGLSGKDNSNLCDLRVEDFKGNTVHLRDGRELEVSDKLRELAVEAAKEYKLYTFEGEESKSLSYAKTDEEIIKLISNSKIDNLMNPRRFYIRLIKIKDFLGSPAMGRFELNESGRKDMIQSLMKEKDYSTVEECIKQNKSKIEYRYNKIQSVPQYVKKYFG